MDQDLYKQGCIQIREAQQLECLNKPLLWISIHSAAVLDLDPIPIRNADLDLDPDALKLTKVYK